MIKTLREQLIGAWKLVSYISPVYANWPARNHTLLTSMCHLLDNQIDAATATFQVGYGRGRWFR